MIKEALEWTCENFIQGKFIKEGQRVFMTKKLLELHKPSFKTVEVNSLQAIIDYIDSGEFEHKELMIHVVSHKEVRLLTKVDKVSMEMQELLKATTKSYESSFPFARKLDRETFIIELMSKFVDDEKTDRAGILQMAGNLSAEKIKNSTDDGVTQTVQTRKGSILGTRENVKNPVTLRPFRTFIEAEQPVSSFTFRAHQNDDELPLLALYEADGNLWKVEAINSIMKFFADHENLKDISIIA